MPGVLSHEQKDKDEYFVPIAVKCIGDPVAFEKRLGDRMSSAGKKRFAELVSGFADYFAADATNPWRDYWKADGTECMFTKKGGERPHAGFYEIVATQAATDGKAVLVGYSQGGLVARFVAFLDEYLMRPDARSVAGFITVQAPNSGSPLANPANADTVARGVFAVLSGALSFPVLPPGHHRELGDAFGALAAGTLTTPDDGRRHFDIAAVAALLQAAEKSLAPGANSKLQRDTLATARKWLTGLLPVRASATAFADLDPASLDRPATVLGLLQKSPITQTLHGAIVGTDNGLSDFVAEGRPFWVRFALRHFAGKAGFADAIANAEQAYAQISMNEREATARSLTGREAVIADAFCNGCRIARVDGARVKIEPYAHDFIIPSVSQALGPLDGEENVAGEYFLGNDVNTKGTHISGGDALDEDSDQPFVMNMLEGMGRRLG